MTDYHIDDASTVDTQQPFGDLSWTQPSIPESSTVQLESKRRRKLTINSEIFSAEAQATEVFSRSIRLFALLPDGSLRELTSSSLQLPLNLARAMSGLNVRLDNSTISYDPPYELEKAIERLFDTAKGEFFEDGVETDFSRNLLNLIRAYGDTAVEMLTGLIVSEYVDSEVASEALRWIGRLDDAGTYKSRLQLLEKSLGNSAARVRDGALLGLASLDDPSAIRYLEKALQGESLEQLRRNIQQVLDQLVETQAETLE